MKRKPFMLALVIALSVLLLLSGLLFRQNQQYKIENRELILQNDSLIAVTIELKRLIDSSADGSQFYKKASPSILITKN